MAAAETRGRWELEDLEAERREKERKRVLALKRRGT
jgi:hypothetical protein